MSNTLDDLCKICGLLNHWCEGLDGECGAATGHYGTTPAKFCDECRHRNIIATGMAGDEPGKERLAALIYNGDEGAN